MFDATISRRAMELQAKVGKLLGLFGEGIQGPTLNESDESFQRRLLAAAQSHSERFRFSNFDSQSPGFLDDTLRMVIEDAEANFKKPSGPLRPAVRLDSTGRRITEWFGDPLEAWREFSTPPRYLDAVALDQKAKRAMAGLQRE